MFIAFTSLAYLGSANSGHIMPKECDKKQHGNGDMFFESLVTHVVDAIIISK
jgi:hypothetical protein